MENARVFIRDDTVYVAYQGALYQATDGNKFRSVGSVDVGFPDDTAPDLVLAARKSVAYRPRHQRVELLVGGKRVYGCWTEKEKD